jgi:hypothetical protein
MKKMEFEIYSQGVVHASVCTSLPLDVATERLNQEYPAGGTLKWAPSEDPTFAGGQPNPCSCTVHEGNQHYLFNC